MNFHFNEEEQEILDMLHDYAVKDPLMNLFAAGLFTNTVQKNRKRNTLQLLLQVRS